MTGQDLAGFAGSEIQKILLLYAGQDYGMYHSTAGASSGGGETVTCKSSASAAVYRLSTSKHPLFQSQPAEVSFATCTY